MACIHIQTHLVQLIRGGDRAHNIVATLHNNCGDVADSVHVIQYGSVAGEEAVVHEEVRLHWSHSWVLSNEQRDSSKMFVKYTFL